MNLFKSKKFKAASTLAVAVALCASLGALVGCSSSSTAANNAASNTNEAKAASLSGKELNIYCGAGMTDPFTEIAKKFEEQTGCKVNVTYGNAATIQNQIKTTESGDFFIAGSAEELKPVSDYVTTSTDLVKHIPVIAVPEGNPANINSLADFANAEMILIGDPEATPVGKIAKKALTDAGLWEQLNASGKINTSTTAPQIAAALQNGQGSAGIVWKENAGKCTIVAEADMAKYIKTIPAAQLKCGQDEEAMAAMTEFLNSADAQAIWTSYGYELVK